MTENCPSRFEIMEWKSGDLDPYRAEQMNSHLSDCPRCRSILESLESNISEYEKRAKQNQARIEDSLSRENLERETRPGWFAWLKPVPAFGVVAATLAVVLVFVFKGGQDEPAGDASSYGVKGTLVCEVFAKRGSNLFKVESGTSLQKKDALRFVLQTPFEGFVTIFSIDASGKISSFYPHLDPVNNPQPYAISSAGRHELPGSIVLDSVVGPEVYIIVYSKKIFRRDSIHARFFGAITTDSIEEVIKQMKKERFEIEAVEVEKVPVGRI